MVLVLTEDDVTSALSPATLYPVLEQCLRRWGSPAVRNRPRIRVGTGQASLHVLAGADGDAGYLGVKTYASVGRGTGHVVLLYSIQDGRLAAVVQATALGALRTGVLSAVATRHIHGPTRVLAVIGSGLQAEMQVRAVVAAEQAVGGQLDEIRVFSRNADRRERFAARLGPEVGTPVRAVGSAADAARGADVICTATTSVDPVLAAGDIDPGTHVNAAGSNSLARRELATDVLARAAVVVDSRAQARQECGDLLPAVESGAHDWDQLPELGEVVSGVRALNRDADCTVFESQGLGVFDVTACAHAVAEAECRQIGRQVALFG